jgi:hypothetical protein
MKGPDDTRIREAVAYLHGRLEIEIDYYCERKGISSLEVAPLVGAALGGQAVDNLPAMRQAPRQAHSPAPEMEVVSGAHGGGAQAKTRGRPRQTAAGKVIGRPRKDAVAGETKLERRRRLDREARRRRRGALREEEKSANYSNASKGYWAKMTPEQRAKEMRRRAKVALAKGHKVFPSLQPGSKNKKRNYDAAKQALYVQRTKLRKQGVPEDQLPQLPALPKAG